MLTQSIYHFYKASFRHLKREPILYNIIFLYIAEVCQSWIEISRISLLAVMCLCFSK